MSCFREHKEGTLLQIHAQPRASRNALVGMHGEALKIAVQAPPVDSAANEAIQELLAEIFGIAKSRVELRRGATARKKTFQLIGIGLAQAEASLAKALG